MSRIALVTGGSRGIGRSVALHLAAAGVDVVLTYQSREDAAAEVVAAIESDGRRAVALPLDLTHPSSFAAFADRVSAVLTAWSRDSFDVLVHNAGTGLWAPLLSTTEAQLDEVFAVHLKAPLLLTQALAPKLADGGRVLFVSSGLTRFTFPGYGAYAAAKGSVEVAARYLAAELAPRRISVNTVAPGAIETDFGGGAVRDTPELNRTIASHTALGRVGLPDDVGGAVAALVGPATGWITGQRIEISGGMSL